MKKFFAILLAAALTLTLAGCGGKDRLNYVNGLEKYVTVCDIENITVDTNGSEYIEIYKNAMNNDLATYTQNLEEGVVADGDIANIDYAGKVDGVAFTGGTAEKQDLTIGSGKFIEGFEEQLIGVKIGDTVDIEVTFPVGYNDSTDLETGSKTIKLSGTDAVFTVTINSVKRHFAEVNDDFAVAAGFKTADEYLADLKDRCIKNSISDFVTNNSTVKKLPPDSDGNSYSYHKQYYTDYAQYYGYTFENFLTANGIDEATFKNDVLSQEVIMYAILDKLGLKVTEEDRTKKVEELAKINEVSVEEVKKAYTDNYVEYICVNNKVVNALFEKAKIVE